MRKRGRAFLDDHHRNDLGLSNTGTKNSTDKPPSWLHFCQNKFRNSGCWLVCKNALSFYWLSTRKQWPWLPSIHPSPWNHRIVKTGKDPVQAPGPATHQVLPPGQGGWQQLLLRAGPYSHCPKEGSCCQELKVASLSLLTVNILQPVSILHTGKCSLFPRQGQSNCDCFFQLPFGALLGFSSLQGTMTSSLTVPEGGGFGLKQTEPLLAQTRESQEASAPARVKNEESR